MKPIQRQYFGLYLVAALISVIISFFVNALFAPGKLDSRRPLGNDATVGPSACSEYARGRYYSDLRLWLVEDYMHQEHFV